MKKKEPKKEGTVKLIVYSFFLVLITFMISGLNRSGIKNVEFMNLDIPVASFSGVLTVLMLLISLTLLNIDNKRGFVIGVMVSAFQLFSVSASVFLGGNISSLAGVPMSAGTIFILFVQHKNILKIEQNEKRLHTLSETDPLTGLHNRRFVTEYVEQKIADGESFRLLFFDLDNFKNINDTMGHASGDRILCETARRWEEIADDSVEIGRIGGDEFAMVVSGQSDDWVEAFALKCLKVLSEKISTSAFDYYATGSAGMARFPEDGRDGASLFRFADTAMYKAKSKGKNQFCLFDEQMLLEIDKDMRLEHEIRNGLAENRFYLVFQPQYEALTKRLRGFETLLRLKDEGGKIVSPGDFIPVAERNGLILEIDRWVLHHAMLSFVNEVAKHPELIISVNISARHVVEPGLASEINELLKETGFPAKNLEIEVTESCFIASVDKAIRTLEELRTLGVHISLDDFGTGYASLSYLKKLPIDSIKVDKVFIDDMLKTEDGGNFVEIIVAIGHMFHCMVISEGVEEECQLDRLRDLHCDFIQGYVWGKPMEKESALELLS